MLDRVVVEQEPRLKIVGAVDDHVDALGQLGQVRVVHVSNDRFDHDRGIYPTEFLGRGDRFGKLSGNVVFVEQDLPLQIARFEEVAIDDPHVADPGSHQGVGQHATEGSTAADQQATF